MLIINRYLNGKHINEEDIPKIVIDSEEIWVIINAVNRRLKENSNKEYSYSKTVEKPVSNVV